jgi:predicted CoA-binding protein
MPVDDDCALRRLLESVHTIAVLGIKAGERDDAYRVPLYMQRAGYRILPVNPKLECVLGERAVPHLAELREPCDLVDVFRAIPHLPGHTDEILALPWRPRCVWFQEGIRHDGCAERLEAAGIEVVQDRCLMVDHQRLLGARA